MRRPLHRPWLLLAALCLLLWAAPAHALCVGPLCSCSVSTTAVVFGNVSPLSGSPTDSTGSVSVSCGGVAGLLIPYQIDLNAGGGASYATRRLSSGADTLSYNLYTDNSRLSVWGNGSGGTQSANGSVTLSVLGSSPAQVYTVYGRIPGGQTSAVPGSYTDTITVTVTYY
jgi:spore coat protein U-like protein